MNQTPLVSILLLTANRHLDFLEEAVASVIGQTYDNWEMLITDYGSEEVCSGLIRQQGEKISSKIHHWGHEHFQGQNSNPPRNFAFSRAKGDWVAFLSADDVWSSHKLEKQIGTMKLHPEADMIYGTSQYWWGWTGNPEDRRRDRVQAHGIQADELAEPPALLKLFLQGKLLVPNISSILIRREVLDKIGMFEGPDFGEGHLYWDQAFLAKAYLEAHIYISSECWDRYRQYPDSVSPGVIDAKKEQAARRIFLDWLTNYLSERGYRHTEIWQTLKFEKRLRRYWIVGRSIKRAQRFIWRRQGGYPLCIKK